MQLLKAWERPSRHKITTGELPRVSLTVSPSIWGVTKKLNKNNNNKKKNPKKKKPKEIEIIGLRVGKSPQVNNFERQVYHWKINS